MNFKEKYKLKENKLRISVDKLLMLDIKDFFKIKLSISNIKYQCVSMKMVFNHNRYEFLNNKKLNLNNFQCLYKILTHIHFISPIQYVSVKNDILYDLNSKYLSKEIKYFENVNKFLGMYKKLNYKSFIENNKKVILDSIDNLNLFFRHSLLINKPDELNKIVNNKKLKNICLFLDKKIKFINANDKLKIVFNKNNELIDYLNRTKIITSDGNLENINLVINKEMNLINSHNELKTVVYRRDEVKNEKFKNINLVDKQNNGQINKKLNKYLFNNINKAVDEKNICFFKNNLKKIFRLNESYANGDYNTKYTYLNKNNVNNKNNIDRNEIKNIFVNEMNRFENELNSIKINKQEIFNEVLQYIEKSHLKEMIISKIEKERRGIY